MKTISSAVWSESAQQQDVSSSCVYLDKAYLGDDLALVRGRYESIFAFIESEDAEKYQNIILEDALTKFSTEGNYRRALACLFEVGSKDAQVVISELLTAPNLVLLFRALRTLGIDQHVDISTVERRCLISFKRGLAQLNERLWNMDCAPYLTRDGHTAVERVINALAKGEAYSMVRVGHCEVRFLAHGYLFGDTDIKASATLQWGHPIDIEKSRWIRNNLTTTIANANMLGFKSRGAFSAKPLKVLENSVAACLANLSLLKPGQIQVDPNVHFDLGKSSGFLYALSKARKVVLITPRHELQRKVADALGDEMQVELVSLPGEFRIDGPSGLEERFARFREIENEVARLAGRGVVFLVGAGVGGKQYCELARAGGGIGLDMGSTLDAWAGVESRGSGFASDLTGALARFQVSRQAVAL